MDCNLTLAKVVGCFVGGYAAGRSLKYVEYNLGPLVEEWDGLSHNETQVIIVGLGVSIVLGSAVAGGLVGAALGYCVEWIVKGYNYPQATRNNFTRFFAHDIESIIVETQESQYLPFSQ